MTETVATDVGGKHIEYAKDMEGGTEQSDTLDRAFQISLETVKVESAADFPIDVDIAAVYQNIFAARILRNVDYINLYDSLCETLFSDRGIKLGQLLFWMVFCTKFQPESEFLSELRQKISKLYSKIFTLLPKPKDSLVNLLIYLMAYAVHISFWDIFTDKDKALFNMRFILDCYHIVLFELHGIFLSDQSIQNTIEKLFGSKFFFYEKKKDKQKKKSEMKDRRDQPLLRDLEFNPDSLMNVEGGIEFAAELSSKLRDKNRQENSPHDKPKTYGSIRKTVMVNADASNTSIVLKKGQENRARSSVDTQDTSTAGNNGQQDQSDVKKVYFPKIRFDCTQISPTVLRFLNTTTGRTMSQKKKLTIHTDNKNLTAMRNYKVSQSIDNILTVKPVTHEKKKNKKDNMLRDYELKNRPEDYYLGYLPKKLKDRFKDELDLKYVLDQVGTYSLKSKKLDLQEKFKAKEIEKTEKIAEKFFNDTTNQIENYNTVSPRKDNELAEPEVKSIVLDNQEMGTAKKNVFTQFGFDSAIYVSVSASNTLQNRRKGDLVVDSKQPEASKYALGQDSSLSNPLKITELEEGASPLSASQLLFKKLNKSQKKNPLLPLLKGPVLNLEPAQQQKDGIKEFVNKTTEYIPERRMKIQNINLERNDRRKADFFDYEDQQEKKRSQIFVYEDRRKKYMEEHKKYVHRSVDANINDLVSRVIQTKTYLSARKNFSNQRPLA